jgi:hypothetical protein
MSKALTGDYKTMTQEVAVSKAGGENMKWGGERQKYI